MGSRRSNTENQRNDLISHDCGTIASPCRCVTICIHDYRPREAERTRGKKKVEFLGRGRSKCQKCAYIRLHRYARCAFTHAITYPLFSHSTAADEKRVYRCSLNRREKGRKLGHCLDCEFRFDCMERENKRRKLSRLIGDDKHCRNGYARIT